jgi:hypothetical protein
MPGNRVGDERGVLPHPDQERRPAGAQEVDAAEVQSWDHRAGSVVGDREANGVERRPPDPAGVVGAKARCEDHCADLRRLSSTRGGSARDGGGSGQCGARPPSWAANRRPMPDLSYSIKAPRKRGAKGGTERSPAHLIDRVRIASPTSARPPGRCPERWGGCGARRISPTTTGRRARRTWPVVTR